MSVEGPDCEHVEALLLAEYQEALARGASRDELDHWKLPGDCDSNLELERAKECLDLLDRVRRRWTPSKGTGDTATGRCDSSLAPRVEQPTTLGRFQILHELGQGGLGIVYLAYDPKLRRHVALKVPRIESFTSNELRRRFLREAEAAARLSHPNLIAIHDAGEDGAICYIAAEYCCGPTLADWLAERHGDVPIGVAACMTRQLASAVQHAHGRGVLHRDIKPSNVLLAPGGADAAAPMPYAPALETQAAGSSENPHAPSDAAGIAAPQFDVFKTASRTRGEGDAEYCPKLTDFGMAKLLEHEGDATRSGTLIGTPAYMAPEQAEGRASDLDARTDVYALGAVLYELLTGRRPHEGRTDAEVLRHVLLDEPMAPRRRRRDIPRDLEAICLKCLAKRSADRYATAQQLADDLGRFLDNRPTEARPPGGVEHVVKWCRRRPAIAASLCVLAVSLAALFGVVVTYSARLRAEVESSRQLLYAADVRLAHKALEANNVPQTLELLDRQVPQGGQADLRDFTWYYLRGLCHQEVHTLKGHEGPVFGLAFAPDGSRIATAGKDGTVRLWNATDGQILDVLRGHTNEVTQVAFSPDGAHLASASEDRTIRLWHGESGEPVKTLAGHADHVLAVAFSPDGEWLASGSRDETVRVWDVLSGASVATLEGNLAVVRALAFAADGKRLFVGDEDETLQAWSTDDWSELAPSTIIQERFFTLDVAKNSGWLAAAGRRRSIGLWSVTPDGFRRVYTLDGGHSEWIQSVAFSPTDATALASGGKDGVVRLWNLDSRHVQRTLLGHTARVWSVAFSPDGRVLASAGEDAVVKIWNVGRGADQYDPPLADTITRAAFLPEGQTLLTSDDSGFVRYWDAERRLPLDARAGHRDRIKAFCMAPSGALAATRGKNGSTRIWSLETDEDLFALQEGGTSFYPLAWSPDGNRVATSTDDATVVVVDVNAGKIVHSLKHDTAVRQAAFVNRGKLLATTGHRLKLWQADREALVASWDEAHDQIAVSPDGQWFASNAGTMVSLYDVPTRTKVGELAMAAAEVRCLAISPDGRTLAIGLAQPAMIALWDTRTRQELTTIDCSGATLYALTFAPHGDCLVAVGHATDPHQGCIWQWNVRDKYP